ncbi:hypothetical protein CIB48_g5096, partial [Xylaria polymorpha]
MVCPFHQEPFYADELPVSYNAIRHAPSSYRGCSLNVPAYAILSHTWGADELSLQGLQTWHVSNNSWYEGQSSTTAGDITLKAGFVKVKRAAAFAAERGFTYLWVDTCCIDKTSSAELSEAINSMFKWYAQSAECHALLSDVPPVAEQDPQSPAVLLGKARPANISVASRLQWASERQTTRAEDIAYCLLGIFDVNMPLLYGEGQRAFVRLQEVILKSTSDQSIFAWNYVDNVPKDPDSVYGLFAQSPVNFRHCAGIETLPIASTADYCPTLWLRRLGQDQFGRLYPWARKLLPPSSYGMPAHIEGYRPIFVREVPAYYGIPSFRVSPDNSFPLEEAFPLERWNPLTLTLQSEYSRRTELTGLFRLRDDTGGHFDVAVGLSKRRGFTWGSVPMFSDARVSDVTLQGRRYVWLSVIAKIEICTSRELDSIPKEVQELTVSTNARYTKLLTLSYTRYSLEPHQKIGRQPYGVRCRPTPSSIGTLDGQELGPPDNSQDEQAHLLHIAALKGEIALLKKHILPRQVLADRAKYGWTVLHIAAAMGHADVIQYILSQPAADSESLVNYRTTGLLETPLHLLAA